MAPKQTKKNDPQASDAPSGVVTDDDYVSRTGEKQDPIPVQSDNDAVEDPIDPETADSDAQLEKDDKEAIDKNNIVKGRTRGAAKPKGRYQEPSDEQDMPPPSDGTSRIRTEPMSNLE